MLLVIRGQLVDKLRIICRFLLEPIEFTKFFIVALSVTK